MQRIPLFVSFGVTIFLLSTSCFSQSDFTCQYQQKTLRSLACYGSASLSKTTVQGNLVVAGALEARDAFLKSLQMTGDAELINTIVTGGAFIAGQLMALNAEFKQRLQITGSSAVFKSSTVKGPVVVISDRKNPKLEVICRSEIGDVEFKGNRGMVLATQDSVVQGRLINASLKRVDRACPAHVFICL